ncbi:hypothetical protein GCM10010910_00740 [Microbacterium nanhaiense]|uniref:Pentapeptide repeat-containing protein n=1 Tax=Microbacterium nanhaiense TaxID=1301026 RepID=A0ABQ2MVM7_9MICO|nr:pentapeptide repeat-containing protein [Microbacterium nanhaiense]GGO58952.1 hypothetical protein GCM10010910_00740 [Microbacterium nanhaiense]
MARAPQRPVPPRIGAPELPPRLDDAEPSRGADLLQARLPQLAGDVELSYASLEEVRIPSADAASFSLRGATLVDVDIDDLRAVELVARDASLRRVRISGGRIGTLDLADARLAEVELRGLRIDYLRLAAAELEDVLIADCTIGTIDLPRARAARVAFESSRAEEVDPRGLRSTDVDLRGLDVLSYLDPLALRGATLTEEQVRELAPAFALAAGIDVR